MSTAFFQLTANFLMAVSLIGGTPDAAQIKELSIYRLPWNLLTRHDLKPSEVRSIAKAPWQIRSTSAICEALSVLPISELVTGSSNSPDLRLVVDIKFKNGAQSSYYSDGQFLYSADMKCRARINQAQVNEHLLDRLEHLQ